jgi:hypothetical protein
MPIDILDTTSEFKLVTNLNFLLNLLMQADILVLFLSLTPPIAQLCLICIKAMSRRHNARLNVK